MSNNISDKINMFDNEDTSSIFEAFKDMYKRIYDIESNFEKKLNQERIKFFQSEEALKKANANKAAIIEKATLAESYKQQNKLNELKLAAIEKEATLAATYQNARWTEIQKQILEETALQAERDKKAQLAEQKLQNEANKNLLKNDEYRAQRKENLLKEIENNRIAEENKHEQEKFDKNILREAQLATRKEKYMADLDKKGKLKTEEDKKAAEKKFEKQIEHEEKLEKLKKGREARAENAEYMTTALTAKGLSFKERKDALKKATTDEDGNFSMLKTLNTSMKLISNYMQNLNSQIDEIASYKSSIDTRLQGSVTNTHSTGTALVGAMTSILSGGLVNFGSTSYWDNISKQITGAAGISPYVKQEDIASNVKSLVEQGINTNIAQRAFVQTIKDKIASTFDTTNGTLLRLIRIQQQDSTAARLGMESMITQFLNNMYENTEYLNSVSKSVKSSLENAMSLMTAEKAISFEYQVQKWLGSYYSVGVSDSAVQSIAASLGKISSGDITGITEGGAGNLIVMAANQAGLSVANVLAKGLDDSSTNQLMQAMSGYLYDLLKNSEDNLVVQQQIANVYGMTAADLKAIANLYTDEEKTIANIAKSSSDYGESMARLNEMIGTMYKRESISEIMTNAFSNLQYTISAGIANNPVLYATYKVAGILQDVAGGIEIPMVSIMGNTVDLHTSVAELLQVATMSGSLLSGIGHMVAAGGDGGLTTSGLAKGFGIEETSGMTSVSRGGGIGGHMETTLKESTVSESGYIGNTNSNDVKNKTMTDATNDSNQQLVNAKDENTDKTTTDIYNNISNIITIFEAVIAGSKSLHVKVDDYGLTGWN